MNFSCVGSDKVAPNQENVQTRYFKTAPKAHILQNNSKKQENLDQRSKILKSLNLKPTTIEVYQKKKNR